MELDYTVSEFADGQKRLLSAGSAAGPMGRLGFCHFRMSSISILYGRAVLESGNPEVGDELYP